MCFMNLRTCPNMKTTTKHTGTALTATTSYMLPQHPKRTVSTTDIQIVHLTSPHHWVVQGSLAFAVADMH